MLFWDFSEKKFHSLPFARKHKKAAECLRFLFEAQPFSKDFLLVETSYRKIEQWLDLPALQISCTHAFTGRYHFHIQEAGLHLSEHSLLSLSTHFDKSSSEPFLPLTIYLDRLRSASNVGNILRTVEALRLGSIHFSPETPNADHPKVQKCSMGAFKQLSYYQGPFVASSFPTIALELTSTAIPISQFKFPKQFILIVGNEEFGVHPDLLAKSDYVVSIPLHGNKNSLNVSVAFGICAFEIARQLKL